MMIFRLDGEEIDYQPGDGDGGGYDDKCGANDDGDGGGELSIIFFSFFSTFFRINNPKPPNRPLFE